MGTENHKQWSNKNFVNRELARLEATMLKQADKYEIIEQKVHTLELSIVRAIDELTTKLTEVNTRLKTQTRFSMLMVGALIPAVIAVLVKTFIN